MRNVTVILCVALCAVVMAATAINAQTVTPPKARIVVMGVSAEMVKANIPGMDTPSNGLPNVAKGDKVYLKADGVISLNSSATKWASAAFSFSEKPDGATAVFEKIDDLTYFFIADEEGTYRIDMTSIDDAGESGIASIVVNVAKFVGVGGLAGSGAKPPECRVCHSGITNDWEGTGHSRALMPIETNSHFGESCLPCHTTGSPNQNAEDDGWAYRARLLGWQFPAVIQDGNWEDLKTNYPELAKMAHVQCESCHGPGSAHRAVVSDSKTVVTYTAFQCLQCHDSPDAEFDEFKNAGHRNSLANGLNTEYMNRGHSTDIDEDCGRCHTANGYVEVVKGAAFSSAPYADPAPVTCIACHDPHAANNPSQLRKSIETTCTDCHSIRPSSHSGLHNSHQGPMLKGEGGAELPGFSYGSSVHTFIQDRCVQCHMAKPDETFKNKIGGHTFKVMYDNGTPNDPSDDIVNQTGCTDCHSAGVSLQKIQDTQNEIKTLLDELKSYLKLRPDGKPIYQMDPSLTTTERDIHYNWYFVNNDLSYGVHNYQYAKDLLTASIAVAKTLGVERIDGPQDFALGQNYPNPFNPGTTIRFSIPSTQNVNISIYDAAGNLIYTLVNDQYQGGSYSVEWNGTRGEGIFVQSGVYFYRITAGTYTATKKMMLVK